MALSATPPDDFHSEALRMIWRCAFYQNPQIPLLPETAEERQALTPPPEDFIYIPPGEIPVSDTGITGAEPLEPEVPRVPD